MNKKISKWLTLAALLMFAGATFQLTSDHYMPGIVCFAAAVSFPVLQKYIGKRRRK